MAKKEEKSYKIKRKNSKSGKSVTITESQLKAAKRVAKKAYKKIPKKKRYIAVLVGLIILGIFTYIFDVTVMPIKYIATAFNIPTLAARGENELKVHFLDVGQGDSIIIQFPDNTNMIIDGGNTGSSIYNKIIRYAKGLRIKTFDYLMLTHTDSDHCGGLDDVIEYFDIKKIYMPYIEDGLTVSSNYTKFIKTVNNEGAQLEISSVGDEIISTDTTNSFIFALLSPSDTDDEDGEYAELNKGLSNNESSLSEEINDVSPIVLLEYLNVKIMFTGDVNEDAEITVIDRVNSWNTLSETPFKMEDDTNYYVDLDVDLLKVAHHGSNGSTCDEFLSAVKPEYAVISVGNNNYGHPGQSAIDRLSNYLNDDGLYRTDLNGDIVATVSPTADGQKGTLNIESSNQTQSTDTAENEIQFLKLLFIPYDKIKIAA